MAVFDVRFTWRERKLLHRCLIYAILGNVGIGLILLSLGIFSILSIGGRLQLANGNLFDLVFETMALYGFYVLVHNLVGIKLCRNYFHYAEGGWMNGKLFAWTIIGGIVILVGCFMATLSTSTVDRLDSLIREVLLDGMEKYLTDVTWKRKIDGMQIRMECCGIDSYADWHRTYWLQRDLLQLDSLDVLEYAEFDGRVTPPVVPWSCCRTDVKGPCYHDPFQLPNPERDSTYESLNTRGCLDAMKTILAGTLYFSVALISLLFVLQIAVTVLTRLDFTAARNAVALGNRWGASPGWLYGRLDFGNDDGPNLCQIDRSEEDRYQRDTKLIPKQNFGISPPVTVEK